MVQRLINEKNYDAMEIKNLYYYRSFISEHIGKKNERRSIEGLVSYKALIIDKKKYNDVKRRLYINIKTL